MHRKLSSQSTLKRNWEIVHKSNSKLVDAKMYFGVKKIPQKGTKGFEGEIQMKLFFNCRKFSFPH